MSANIMTKIVLSIIGVLVLVQLLFYNGTQSANLASSRDERVRLSQEIEQLSVTRQELQQYLDDLQQEYSEIAASVPEKILQGYDDQEEMLASFLDYIKASEFDSVDAKVSMQGVRKYINKPVPLFEHDMTFDFSFTHLSDAKKFLTLILDQEYYPLVVRNLALRSSGERKISGTLQTSLLIPARQQKPLFSTKEEGS
jgi:cell division protein FtsB